MVTLPFPNRFEAGRLLGIELDIHEHMRKPIVLALARGGVAVGAGVAERWNAPLDVLVVCKLGIPWQSEVAMGAIAGETCLLNQRLIRDLGISDAEVRQVVEREGREVKRREKLYRNNRPAPVLDGRELVLVDDGLATGSTMVAAVRHVRTGNPLRVTIAVPVATSEACGCLQEEAVDECVCLAMPEPFVAVGQWYTDFDQVTDQEVQELLSRSYRPAEALLSSAPVTG
jgi:putative phosphoribosyl transferase